MPKLLLTLLAAIACVQAAVAKERPPNFVVIFTDDQGYQDLGCYGSPDIATPNLDKMAAEGMRFTSFYAQTICGPSRAALMTSSYPLRVAQDKNRCEIHPVVHSKEITIAEVLKPQGYKSAAFGKWDLATHSQAEWITDLLPLGQGFDYFFGTPTSNDKVVHLLRNNEVIERNANMATLTKRYTDEALQFIEKNKDEPFFVYVAHTMPHTKLAVSKDFKGKSKGGFYGDVIEEIDHNAGRILDKVRELDLDDNTYVIFTSDNGPWLIRKAHGGHALPLRSGKTTCWEGGLRVPCIVRAPGRVPAGTTSDLVAATIDLMPTLAKLAGAQIPTDRTLDGIDISNIWHGQQDELDRPYFYYQHFYLRGVRKGDWKVMLKHEEGPNSATAKWKNHVAAKDAKPLTAHQLYNLKDDIGETTDLAASNPDKLAELLKLAKWARNDIGDHGRIGKNARFFDAQPNRLDAQKQNEGKQSAKAKKAPVDNPELPNVLLIGDSISIGYTADVQKQLSGKADVYRIPGNARNSAFGLKNLDRWLRAKPGKWDIIHFNWGLWDLCYRHPESKTQGNRDKVKGTLTATPEQYRDNLEKIVARLKKTGATLIWCNTTPVPEHEAGRKLGDDLKYNAIAAEIMKTNGIKINDLHAHALLKHASIQVKQGDVHFTKEGSTYLAEKVAQEIAIALPK